MASTIPRASCSDNDAVAVKVLISLFSVPAGWTRVLDIRGGTVTGHSAGFRSAPRAPPAPRACGLPLLEVATFSLQESNGHLDSSRPLPAPDRGSDERGFSRADA